MGQFRKVWRELLAAALDGPPVEPEPPGVRARHSLGWARRRKPRAPPRQPLGQLLRGGHTPPTYRTRRVKRLP